MFSSVLWCGRIASGRGAHLLAASLMLLTTVTTVARAQTTVSDSAARARLDSAQRAHRSTADSASVASLPPVRVEATRSTHADAASSVVVRPEAIRTAPANNVWSIIQQTTGIEVHQQGQGPGFASDAVIRGFTSDHSTDVALVVDGVPMNEPVNGHAEGYADWNVVLPEAVSAIHVLKGPTSPWIGNFAMGGEVNVTTVPLANGTRWSARAGSYGEARLSLVTGKVGRSGGWVVAGDAGRQDGWRENSRSSMEHALATRTWSLARGGTFTLSGAGYAAQWRSPGFLSLAQYAAGDLRPASNATDGGGLGTGMLRAAYQQPLSDGTLESMLYGQASDWRLYLTIPPEGGIGEGAASQTSELDERTGGGGYTRYSHQIGHVHLMGGLEYRAVGARYERYYTSARSPDSVFTYEDGTPARLDASYLAVSPVVEAHWTVTHALALGVGGRLDWMRYARALIGGDTWRSKAHVVATPKLSALYRFTPSVSAYAAFNGGFRAADGAIENPSLSPSREYASEVGLTLHADRVEGSVALFDVAVSNEQTFNDVTQTFTAVGRSRRRGVEVDGRVALAPPVALFAHATVNDAHYLRLNDGGVDLSGAPVYGVARASIATGVDLQGGGAAGSIWAAYTGPFTPIGEPGVRTTSYTLLNARGVIPITGPWSLALGIQNVLDTRYQSIRASGFVSPGTPRTVLVTVLHG